MSMHEKHGMTVEMKFQVPGVCEACASGRSVYAYALSADEKYAAFLVYGNFVYFTTNGMDTFYPELVLRLPFSGHTIRQMAVADHRFAIVDGDGKLHVWTFTVNAWKKEWVYPLDKTCRLLEWFDGNLIFRSSDDVYYAFRRRWAPFVSNHWWPTETVGPMWFPIPKREPVEV